MPTLTVRRTGRRLWMGLPHEVVESLKLSPGDKVLVQLKRLPRSVKLAGILKGRITARQVTRLSNDGERLP
jgi:hypothetical protein